jgi:ribosomal protein S18 acetylase RimI-like enzyme
LTVATVRPARRDELPAVLELWRAAGAAPSLTDDIGSLRRLLDTDPEALLLADVRSAVAGSLVAAWDGWRGSFYRLAVAPGQRRRGLARGLVAAGEARLRSRGARRLTAFVDTGEEPALAFWVAVGFAPQRDRLRFVRDLD